MTVDGLNVVESASDPKTTMDRLVSAVTSHGMAVLARIDHAAAAAKAGMILKPTELLIFGNPKAGTPLMLAAPSIAIDLPLKILIREDGEGKVWVSYNSAAFLQARHGLPKELLQNMAVVESLAAKAGE